MDASILVAIISAATGVVVAALSFLFTKFREREADWRQEKLKHYKELMAAISGIVIEHSTPENQQRFAEACNVVGLVASQNVIKHLHVFQQTIKITRAPLTNEEHDKALTACMA